VIHFTFQARDFLRLFIAGQGGRRLPLGGARRLDVSNGTGILDRLRRLASWHEGHDPSGDPLSGMRAVAKSYETTG
jgi:hypothetical protein